MISRKSEEIINKAGRYAFEQRHEYCTIEHVFWALLNDQGINDLLTYCGAKTNELLDDIESHLELDMPRLTDPQENPTTPIVTVGVQNLLQRALIHVQSSGKTEVQPYDLLVSIFQAKDSRALFLLQKQQIERLDIIEALSQSPEFSNGSQSPEDDSDGESRAKEGDPLAQYAVNLNQLAKEGKIDPLIGRQNELDRIVQTLCRRRKNNPILVGEAGVGKTALAEGLALRIVKQEVPDILSNVEIFSLDLGSLVAGTKFRGDFENRVKKVLESLKKRKERGEQPVLFIDEIHNIVGAGSVSGGALDAANLLKPVLSRGDLRCIGSTTYAEYRNIFEKDHALSRRFQKIDIVEPSTEDSLKILRGLKERFESHHEIQITDDALKMAVELSNKHITDRFLPDKAIDVLDEAGARARLNKNTTVDAAEIEETVSMIARIPAKSVTVNHKERLRTLDRDLKLAIFGQDHAVESIVTAIRLSRSGLRGAEKPIGSFLFCGPTGVGKTELSKQLAQILGIEFLRFDMSEYSEKHTVSRLIGAPPGYVGFEQAGLLTDGIRKHPHCVVLLDEIEKAHPDIWNVLLQVMDYGTLTDNVGRKADFRNTVLIMTSNVGARELERKPLGLLSETNNESTSRKEVERAFSPEFRNRLDNIVYFNSLDEKTVSSVVNKQLFELESLLLAKGIECEVDDSVKSWLAKKGFDRLMGARPLARLILDKIRKPLSEEILFGKLEHGGNVKVTLVGDEIKFEIKASIQPSTSTSFSKTETVN